MADRVGEQVGNYRLLRLLGEGGFAQVYLGEHVHLGTLAAIKLLSAKLSAEEVERFREEARTIARLRHPSIVRVLEFGVEGGVPFLVMDYAAGGTLRQRHPKGAPLLPERIVPYVQQVADALQYAHDLRLIHRDVKPENMLLGEREEVLLSDFGIALVAQSSRYQSTQDTAGTIAYMAPEQIQGHPRPASDQYSLGIVVYEWLAGERPFTGSMSEVVAQHLGLPPPPLRERLPYLPAALEQVVLTALEKDPKARFASVQAFASALEQAGGIAPAMAHPSAPMTPAPQPAAPSGLVRPPDQPASWQNAPTRVTSQSEQPPTLQQASAPPTQSLPATVVVPEAQPTLPEASSPTFSGFASRPMVPLAALPTPLRAPHRWYRGLLVGLLVLVLVSSSLIGLGLAGLGPLASLGAAHRQATSTTISTATPKPVLGTIQEFDVPTNDIGPYAITTGPDGNLWFSGGAQLWRITPEGQATGFSKPTGTINAFDITTGPDSNLWFTDFLDGIGRITPGGQITVFGMPTADSRPNDITVGPDGNLWFTACLVPSGGCYVGGWIGRITPGGQFTEFALPDPNNFPWGIVKGPDGNLWFTENFLDSEGACSGEKIGRITPEGQIKTFVISTADCPGDITAGPDGNLWFTETTFDGMGTILDSKIGRITPTGQFTEFPLADPSSGPSSITTGQDGNLWFTERNADQIGRITPQGAITEFPIPTDGSIPASITAGPDGNLWFTEAESMQNGTFIGGNKIGWISPGP